MPARKSKVRKPKPPRFKVEFIVLRSGLDELTFARVMAVVAEEGLRNEKGFLSALEAAVGNWMQDTRAGMSAWLASSEDFNLGDLACELSDRDLSKCLRACGILKLDVACNLNNAACRNWTYDTVLVSPERQQQLAEAH